jgi:hypothetical protein
MSRRRKKSNQIYRVEIVNDAVSISLSYNPDKLLRLLVGVAGCDEMRRQLIRRNSGLVVRLYENVPDVELDGHNDRYHIDYQVRLQSGDAPLEYVPLSEWPKLAGQLNVYIQKSGARMKREAKRAVEFIREQASAKLVRSLRQFLFEGLHAATGLPVTEDKQINLEWIGTMVGKSQGLRKAGLYSPADLRRWERSKLEGVLLWKIPEVRKNKSVTYERVAALMQQEFEFVPVLTGETLRKAVSHHGLNWKEMKKRKN